MIFGMSGSPMHTWSNALPFEMSGLLRPRFNAHRQIQKIRPEADGPDPHNYDAIFHQTVLTGSDKFAEPAFSRDRLARALRQIALAAEPEVFLGFKLSHAEEMAEHLQPMSARQPGQIGGGFRDHGRGLFRAALAARLIDSQAPTPSRGFPCPPASCLGQKITSNATCVREVHALGAQL
jgi:hypothetical protein